MYLYHMRKIAKACWLGDMSNPNTGAA